MIQEKLIKQLGIDYQMSGIAFAGKDDNSLVILFPWENLTLGDIDEVKPTGGEWNLILKQLDFLEVEILSKAPDGSLLKTVLRKSQRQIEQGISWNVYRRDGYKCRYCGKNDVPLTVDHIVTWESGGPSTEDNLLCSCRKCNKLRGNMSYDEWVHSPKYVQLSKDLWEIDRERNLEVLKTIPSIEKRVNLRNR
jgi:hypothetical protein